MLSRYLRPLTVRVAGIAAAPIRTSTFPSPFYIRTIATTPVPASSEPLPSTTTPNVAATIEPEPIAAATQLPYFVGRNNLDNLSVYQSRKRGGNLKLTTVKRGEGNLQALKRDIRDALQLEDKEISVNNVTKHIVIKGHQRDPVVHFLLTMGF
ncbi:mitochondrial large subunit ribosomal protein-domain-containing protein [Astrocystis sublimbata]|nr:mitochondrial large subunit ribosomal protein-domain-containing protein [Astrocystis sublimbata]